MAELTNYDANLIQGAMVASGPVAYATWTPFVALFSTAPDATGAGTECTDATYARKAVPYGAPGATTRQCANNAIITFAAFTGSFTVHYLAIFDAVSGGNMRRFGTTDINVAVGAGVQPTFAIGALTDTLT